MRGERCRYGRAHASARAARSRTLARTHTHTHTAGAPAVGRRGVAETAGALSHDTRTHVHTHTPAGGGAGGAGARALARTHLCPRPPPPLKTPAGVSPRPATRRPVCLLTMPAAAAAAAESLPPRGSSTRGGRRTRVAFLCVRPRAGNVSVSLAPAPAARRHAFSLALFPSVSRCLARSLPPSPSRFLRSRSFYLYRPLRAARIDDDDDDDGLATAATLPERLHTAAAVVVRRAAVRRNVAGDFGGAGRARGKRRRIFGGNARALSCRRRRCSLATVAADDKIIITRVGKRKIIL